MAYRNLKFIKLKEAADAAEVIASGYAFTKDCENIKVLNLNNQYKAACLSKSGK